MSAWRNVTIDDLGQIITGATPPTKKTEYYGGKYPFITPTDIETNSRIVYTQRFLSQKGYEYNRNRLLPPNAICVTCIASIGKICMTSAPSVTNQQINSIIVNEDEYDPYFVYYLLRTNTTTLQGIAGGVAVPIVKKSTFTKLETYVPPLQTQRKIAAILSAYDSLIENNTGRIKILEDMAQTLYREWFVHFRFPGHENVLMVESSLGPIPQGWKVKKLGDLAESVRRNVKPDGIDRQTSYFGLAHLPRKSIALTDWDSVDSIGSVKLALKKGEILFGKIRPYFHKVGVAPLDGICSSDVIVIRPKSNECFAITLACVSSEKFIAYATATSQGTKMPRAEWKVLVQYQIVIPPVQISQCFTNFTCDIVDKIQNLIFQNRNLRQTRDLLLPKLISGEIDVSELDIDTDGIQPSVDVL